MRTNLRISCCLLQSLLKQCYRYSTTTLNKKTWRWVYFQTGGKAILFILEYLGPEEVLHAHVCSVPHPLPVPTACVFQLYTFHINVEVHGLWVGTVSLWLGDTDLSLFAVNVFKRTFLLGAHFKYPCPLIYPHIYMEECTIILMLKHYISKYF